MARSAEIIVSMTFAGQIGSNAAAPAAVQGNSSRGTWGAHLQAPRANAYRLTQGPKCNQGHQLKDAFQENLLPIGAADKNSFHQPFEFIKFSPQEGHVSLMPFKILWA
jgi:hypothetical protein